MPHKDQLDLDRHARPRTITGDGKAEDAPPRPRDFRVVQSEQPTPLPASVWRQEAEVRLRIGLHQRELALSLPDESDERIPLLEQANAHLAFARGRAVVPPSTQLAAQPRSA